MAVIVTRDAMAQLRAVAGYAHPNECCGLLLGERSAGGEAISVIVMSANIHPQPERYFTIDPRVQIDAQRAERGGGPQVLGYFHSHPHGPPRPSKLDQQLAHGDGKIWAIIAPNGCAPRGGSAVSLWRDGLGGLTTLAYRQV